MPNAFKEVASKLGADIRRVGPRTHPQRIHAGIYAAPAKHYMQLLAVTQDALYAVRSLSVQPGREWKCARLLETGVLGWQAKARAELELLPEVRQFLDFIDASQRGVGF